MSGSTGNVVDPAAGMGGQPTLDANGNVVAPGTAKTATTDPWYTGKADSETLGHWQLKGWNLTDPVALALDATKAQREAERYVGVPPAQLLKLPKDQNDEQGWKDVWGRLGVPKEAKDYDFSGIKFANGEDLDAPFVERMKATAHKLNLPKDAAAGLIREFVQTLEGFETSEASEKAVRLAAERDTLTQNWGNNKEQNLFVAKRAAQMLGVDGEALTALENQIGYSKVMEMFRNIGQRMGEAKYVEGGNPNLNNGVMTREQAMAKKTELMTNKEWRTKYLGGDAASAREMTALNTLIVGDDTDQSRRF